MTGESLPLVEGVDGATLLSTWQIVMREDFDFARAVFEGAAPASERSNRLLLTLHHEAVHFYQGMTAALPFSYSCALFEVCTDMLREAREWARRSESDPFAARKVIHLGA